MADVRTHQAARQLVLAALVVASLQGAKACASLD